MKNVVILGANGRTAKEITFRFKLPDICSEYLLQRKSCFHDAMGMLIIIACQTVCNQLTSSRHKVLEVLPIP